MNLRMCGVAVLVALAIAGCREPNAPAAIAPDPVNAAPASGKTGIAPARSASTLCNIESIDGKAFGASPVEVTKPVRIVGWLGSQSGSAPQAPMLRLADSDSKSAIREYPLQLVIERPDVVQVFPGKEGLKYSGFDATLDPRGLGATAGHLYLIYQDGGVEFLCDNGRHVEIVP